MADHVNWGILGAATFARLHMGPAIHAAPGGTLAALATRSPEKADPFIGINPHLKVYGDYDALLSDPEIQAVYIPLPNHMHVDWTLKALSAGKHVLTEKPVALHTSEIDELIVARDRTGLLAAEAFMIVHHPQWQRAREIVQSGEIGELLYVDGAFSFDNREDTDNIRNRPETGGGALRDIGVYVFGSARFVSGQEPEDVTAAIRWENGIDVLADVGATFPDFRYHAYVSIRMFPRQEMVFHGDKGVLYVAPAPFNAPDFAEARLEIERPSMTRVIERFTPARHYDLQVAAFNKSILTGADYPCPLEFSRGTQRMMDMAFEAAKPNGHRGS
ncbi:MAG: Gfo/Idh/MocA family oxidoreductase [Pseudomonadota bacterium]